MLIDLFKRIFLHNASKLDPESLRASFVHANELSLNGDTRSAIIAFREHLLNFPLDVEAMNNLGCCLVDIGDLNAAGTLFEKAFAINDSYLPVVINHAKCLGDKNHIDDGLQFLRQAKAYNPDSASVYSVYAGMAHAMGDTDTACTHALKAWLASFDTLRLANCALFYSSYRDIDDARLAAEHRFWAETLLPRRFSEESLDNFPTLPPKSHKIRIGYWSPDFRNHSVRYFALPLIENHDRNQFEIIVYHDTPFHDEHTDAIKSCADHFIPTCEITDARLVSMMHSHQLDILVELAGHSSANRINLLRERLAKRQISGLGYPPTTGLSTIDGKLLDPHIADADSTRYYTEPPLVLDHSFWCFDPKETPEICTAPPITQNAYITFACVGNIAKITQPILDCWSKILHAVPGSRLLIRSISLNDAAAAQFISKRLERSAIDLARVDLHGPQAGTDFFTSYNGIDIILDTYPFNGGTTTCFATYMGVPVLSMAGKSLFSRMGKSVLSNLGLNDWIVSSYDEYVVKAILLSQDVAFLTQFRAQARERYSFSALGNGKLFARDFEKLCLNLLDPAAAPAPLHQVETLPAEELVARAYTAFRYGQFEAAGRIVDHCLSAYPNCGTAHVLWTQRLTELGKFVEAAEHLGSRLDHFAPDDRFTALVNIARFNILANRPVEAKAAITMAKKYIPDIPSKHLQFKLLESYQEALSTANRAEAPETKQLESDIRQLAVLIVCDDETRFAYLKDRLQKICTHTKDLTIHYLQCSENDRWKSYKNHLFNERDDAFIVIQKNIDICNEHFFIDLLSALERFDIVGIGGAKLWDRIDWRHCPIEQKASSILIASGEGEGFYEINFSGDHLTPLVPDLAVLDGVVLAIRKAGFFPLDSSEFFDPLLEGGGTLQEEFFTHAAFNAGLKLAAHMNLGVILDWKMPMTNTQEDIGDARWQLAQQMSFDPLLELAEDRNTISIPVESPQAGMRILDHFLKN